MSGFVILWWPRPRSDPWRFHGKRQALRWRPHSALPCTATLQAVPTCSACDELLARERCAYCQGPLDHAAGGLFLASKDALGALLCADCSVELFTVRGKPITLPK